MKRFEKVEDVNWKSFDLILVAGSVFVSIGFIYVILSLKYFLRVEDFSFAVTWLFLPGVCLIFLYLLLTRIFSTDVYWREVKKK